MRKPDQNIKTHVALLIPKVSFEPLTLIRTGTNTNDISDLDEDTFNVTVDVETREIDAVTLYDFIIKSTMPKHIEHWCKLTGLGETKFGHLAFELSYDNSIIPNTGEKDFLNIKREFPNAIYNMIKDFFHDHQYHRAEVDSLLAPYMCEDKVKFLQYFDAIEKENEINTIIDEYIDTNIDKYKGYSRSVHDSIIDFKNNGYFKKSFFNTFSTSRSEKLFELCRSCENAIGEKHYADTILNAFKDNPLYADRIRSIDRFVSSIGMVRTKAHNEATLLVTFNSLNLAIKGLKISIFALIITLFTCRLPEVIKYAKPTFNFAFKYFKLAYNHIQDVIAIIVLGIIILLIGLVAKNWKSFKYIYNFIKKIDPSVPLK